MVKKKKRVNKKRRKDNEKTRRNIIIIIIIIIILLLITSCNSSLFGRIGDLFNSSSNHIIDPDTGDKRVSLNTNVLFDVFESTISLDEDTFKIGYTIKKIVANNLTCTTSDAEIATCVVKNGYVEITPKQEGTVTVTLESEQNDWIYRSTTKLNINRGSKGITLSGKSGSLNLKKSKTKKIPYYLAELNDDVKVTVSDEEIASATAKNGVLTIKGKKNGTVTVTLEIEENGKKYTASYQLTITNGKTTTTTSTTNKTTTTSKNSSITTSKIIVTSDKTTTKKNTTTTTAKKPTTTATTKKNTTTTTTKKPTTTTKKNTTTTTTKKPTTTTKKNTTTTKKPTTTTTTTKKNTTTTTTKKPTTTSSTKKTTTTTKTTTTSTTTTSTTKKPTTTSTTTTTTTTTTKPTLSSNNLLSNLEVNSNSVDGFSPNTKTYTVNVVNSTDKVTINAVPQDSKATVEYVYNGDTYKEFKDIKISDSNTVKVVVTAENGDKETYTVNIIRDKNNDANLTNIKVSGFDLDRKFDKDTTSYYVETKYNTDSINISAEASDNKATLYINGEEASSSNIKLNEGTNEVEIKVVAEDETTTKTYKVTINKPIRTIEFNKDTPNEFKIENSPFNIGYEVLEDGDKTDDYETSQIQIDKGTFKGEIKLEKDIIELVPLIEDINIEHTITLTYNGKTTSINVKFTKEDYYMRLCEYGDCKIEYDISFKDGKGEEVIILYTNILKDYEITETANGVILKNKKSLNDEGIITIISTDPSVASVVFEKDENDTTGTSYVIRVIAHKVGSASIQINGQIYGEEQDEIDVKINVTTEYIVKLNANGGFLSPLADEYEFVLSSSDELDLSKYEAYKTDSEETCQYFTLLGWSKDKTSENSEYAPDAVITDINDNMTLYAIYSKTSEIVNIPTKSVLYLSDVDIFVNPKTGEKLIAPGVEGNHVMTFENHSGESITITSIYLEEDTICISENRCLNMGYILKNTVKDEADDEFYYGEANGKYEILNLNANTTYAKIALNRYHTVNQIATEIEIPKDGMAEVTLLWQWVEVDDALDTEIGKSVTDDNNTYDLTIWIEFEKTNEECVVNN